MKPLAIAPTLPAIATRPAFDMSLARSVVSGAYSFRAPMCVFSVLENGQPVIRKDSGLPLEFSSLEAAEHACAELAARQGSARERFSVEREWL